VSSRTARAIQRNPVSKKKTKQNKTKKNNNNSKKKKKKKLETRRFLQLTGQSAYPILKVKANERPWLKTTTSG
jgi:predicted chitinase